MNVLIDLNIILDVILKRPPWLTEATKVWDAHVQGQIRGHLVATSLTNLFYIAGASQATSCRGLDPGRDHRTPRTTPNAHRARVLG